MLKDIHVRYFRKAKVILTSIRETGTTQQPINKLFVVPLTGTSSTFCGVTLGADG